MKFLILTIVIGLEPSAYYASSATPVTSVDYYQPSTETLVHQALPKPVAVNAASSAVSYPVRSNHWTYPGHNRAELIAHLLTDGNHRGRFTKSYLDGLTYQQLLSLHDDHHEGKLKTQYLPAASVTKQDAHVAKSYGQVVYQTHDGKHQGPMGTAIRNVFGCPNGRCPR